jgi:glyoxylase-like metal-dependent hydrolase (beta-lactamase superfamily II)
MADQDLPLRAAIVPVTPFQQNCAILWCTKTRKAAVVDPGGDVERILQGLEQVGAEPERILLTHGHIDHAGGAAELAERLSVPIVGPHRDDKWLLDSLPEAGAGYGMTDARPCAPDRWLEEGDEVRVGEVGFEVLHCPGHTSGHVAFVNRELGFGVVGDILFQGSVGRTDLPRGNHGQLIRSIRTKLLPLPDSFFFLCGHGPASTIGHERQSNPFLR